MDSDAITTKIYKWGYMCLAARLTYALTVTEILACVLLDHLLNHLVQAFFVKACVDSTMPVEQ